MVKKFIWKKASSQPSSPEDVIKKVEGLAEIISEQVSKELPNLKIALQGLEVNELMGEKEHGSALESVYWAISLLRLIQKSESGWIPQEWVPELLNKILTEMESEQRGCRVRFARQMLQEYAEMIAKSPEASYQLQSMLDYFRAWLWECLKKVGAQRPDSETLSCFDSILTPFLNKNDLWD